MRKLYFILALMLFVAASCAKIDELSDSNAITEFRIISHSPETIELGVVEIAEDVIYIPIAYGKYEFPLHFRAQFRTEGRVDRVTGVDFSEELVLQSMDDEIKFYVQATSGLTRVYYIRPREVPLDENNYISTNIEIRSVSPQAVVSPYGTLSADGDTLRIYAIDPEFPMTVIPRFTIEETSKFIDFENGFQELVFDEPFAFHDIDIMSASGGVRTWSVKMVPVELISGTDAGDDPSRRETTNVNLRTISAAFEGYDDIAVDNDAESIKLIERGASFPIDAAMHIEPVDPRVQMLDMEADATLAFNSVSDTHRFYFLDPVTRVARLYTVSMEAWKNNKADVTGFTYTYTAASVATKNSLFDQQKKPAITLAAGCKIFPESGEIVLSATAINNAVPIVVIIEISGDNWKLTLNNVNIALSQGATIVSSQPPFVWDKNGSWQTPIGFTVRAADGTLKEWKVVVRDGRGYIPSDQCELVSMGIEKTLPMYTVLSAELPEINAEERKVTIKVLDDEDCYPMSIYPRYTVSSYAKVLTEGPLVFTSPEDTRTVTVEAENGATSEWTVKLNVPERLAGADVIDFGVTGFSSTAFGLQSTEIDDENGILNIYLSKMGTFPASANYSMTLSSRATADVPLRGAFTFANRYATPSFTVTAQDGSTREWKARLVYLPQLTNWNLDSWADDNTPVSWASANNIAVKGTSKTAGAAGQGSAAQLKTGSALGQQAAGSLFLGEFKFNVSGASNPTQLTWFGVPFAATKKIIGIDIDIWYHPGNGAGSDNGSMTIDLIKWDGVGTYEYHGGSVANGVWQKDKNNNTHADLVARGLVAIGTKAGSTMGGDPVKVIPDSQWITVRVPIDFVRPGANILDYTHISVCCSSSADGDSFVAETGSTLKVDNVKIIYED